MKKIIKLSSFLIAILICLVSAPSFSANHTLYGNPAAFQTALGSQVPLTQDFEEPDYSFGDNLDGITFLPGVAVTSNMDTIEVRFGSGSDQVLFAFDTGPINTRATSTRTYYDITFTLLYNAVGFNIDVWNPAANGPGNMEVFFEDSTSFSVDLNKTTGLESDPFFFGIIADSPIVRIRWSEPPEIAGVDGWEETVLDDFAVANTFVFSADFNADTTGQAPSLNPPGAPAGDFITLINPDTGGNSMIVQGPASGFSTNSLRIHKEAGTGNSPIFEGHPDPDFGPYESGIYTVTWRSLSEQSNGNFGFAAIVDSANLSVFVVNYLSDGTISFQDGSGPIDTGITYTVNVPQTFRSIIDLDNRYFDLFINGIQVGFNQPFADPGFTGLDRFFWEIGGTITENYAIDDIKIVPGFYVFDSDEDGVLDDVDNCPDDRNPDQLDTDRDKIGDICDDDDDNDTVPDTDDNCPLVFNLDQANRDGDNYGDACDNCPDIVNNEDPQADSDGDGLGDACEDFNENLNVPVNPLRPGEPLWVTATFFNNTEQPIQTIRPDCFNTTFTVMNPAGNVMNPRYRIRAAYGIPRDLVFIPPGPFNVTCNLAEMFDQRVLTSGPGGSPAIYDVVATYSNDHLDPDIVNGVCTDPDNECYNLIWTGEVSSTPQSVSIAGSPVTTAASDVVFVPNVWVAQWALVNGPPISAQISNIDGHAIADIDPSTILLNGIVPIVGSRRNKCVLTVQFDRSQAVQSLGTIIPGTYYPAVQGAFKNGSADIFYGQGRIELLEAIDVEIDIKPGSFPNTINLKSKGKVPVAIFSTPEFDATTIDPNTVTLAGAGVTAKGKGKRLMASFEDKNGDGLMDLVVHVCTQTLQISKSDKLAVLEGETYENIPIIGSDSIRIVPRKWSKHLSKKKSGHNRF